jgi:hypothetical protein
VQKLRVFKVTVSPKRDRTAPYKFLLKSTLTPPAGVAAKTACTGKVAITVKAGKKTVAKRSVVLRAKCTWSLRLTFANRRKLGNGRLSISTSYLGNKLVRVTAATKLAVRAG